jgi:hypothetical protein
VKHGGRGEKGDHLAWMRLVDSREYFALYKVRTRIRKKGKGSQHKLIINETQDSQYPTSLISDRQFQPQTFSQQFRA